MAVYARNPPVSQLPPRRSQAQVLQHRKREGPLGRHLVPTHRGEVPAGSAHETSQRALGHDFSRVRIHADATADAGPSPARAAAPIQLVPHWKRLLAGAGALAGAGTLATGLALASPALAIGGGVGLLASAYLGYRPHLPVASVLDEHRAQQGFTGVYDTKSGRLAVRPSATDLSLRQRYTGWVNRRGGHADVSRELGPNRGDHRGFAAILQQDGGLALTWRSGQLNPARGGNLVEGKHRPTIINALERETGRKVSRR